MQISFENAVVKEFESRICVLNEAMKTFTNDVKALDGSKNADAILNMPRTNATLSYDVLQKLMKRVEDPEYFDKLVNGCGNSVMLVLQNGYGQRVANAPRELVIIALAFVGDGNQYAAAKGLSILDELCGDVSTRFEVMRSVSIVQTLLDYEVHHPGG